MVNIYKDSQNRIKGGHIENILLIKIPKIELNDSHIGFMLIIQIPKIELNGGHI